ncbi:MAG: hypothetical protein ACKO6N_07125 [Myxococcota bacterium]
MVRFGTSFVSVSALRPALLGLQLLTAATVALLPAPAQAASVVGDTRFYILSVEGDRVFIDMGRQDGVSENQLLQIFKTNVSFDHPVSGQKIVGTTYLADVQVVEVGDAFSIVKAQSSMLPLLKPGYEVRFRPQDLEQVRSARARLQDMAASLAIDAETWEQRARREMVRFNNNNNKISMSAESVYFDPNDHYTRLQSDFTYRVFRGLYAVRFGIGSLNGRGETGYDYDLGTTEYGDVAFYYGYTQLEFRFSPYFSLMPTLQLGLNNDGVGYGFGGNMRIGPELGTNIVVSGSAAAYVGGQLGLSYNHYINERLVLSGKAAWENFVTGSSSPGSVRVMLGAHYDLTPKLQLDVSAGLGGRDIDNMGPTAMLGLSYNFATGLWWMQELE